MMNEGVYAASQCHQVSVAAHLCVPVRRDEMVRQNPQVHPLVSAAGIRQIN